MSQPKNVFVDSTMEKINSGEVNLDAIKKIYENRDNLQVSLDDVNIFLQQAYRYTYLMAMENGHVDPLESSQLLEIQSYYGQINGLNKVLDKTAIMARISKLVRRSEHSNGLAEQMEALEQKYETGTQPKRQSLYPKPSPYQNWM